MNPKTKNRSLAYHLKAAFDNSTFEATGDKDPRHIDWLRSSPFWLSHLALISLYWVGVSPVAIGLCVLFYFVRMFGITGFYHRYFSHRTFRTSRVVQFLGAVLGASSAQRGPIWWASHHRHHHRHSDEPVDSHSPKQDGFWWSHVLWFLADKNFPIKDELVKDLNRYPELRFLDRYDYVIPLLYWGMCYLIGDLLATHSPELGTNGWQMLVWGGFVSTVLLWHGTFTINSLAHKWGSTRYKTGDDSRNNWFLAILTLGEGWHNNHHHYQHTARQGFYWWEFDITYYILWLGSCVGLVSGLKQIPEGVRESSRAP
ncbi:MAG: acyl-CoA desaturase [Planctomycetota bacterium]